MGSSRLFLSLLRAGVGYRKDYERHDGGRGQSAYVDQGKALHELSGIAVAHCQRQHGKPW